MQAISEEISAAQVKRAEDGLVHPDNRVAATTPDVDLAVDLERSGVAEPVRKSHSSMLAGFATMSQISQRSTSRRTNISSPHWLLEQY